MAKWERKTLSLIRVKGEPQKGATWTRWDFVSGDGEKYGCFDGALVKAFEDRRLAGKQQTYLIQPSAKGPSLKAIPGVYEPEKRAGGGSGGVANAGPMLTNRQAALFAAVFQSVAMGDPQFVPWLFDQYLKRLEAGSGETSAAGQGVPGRTAEVEPVRGPVSSANNGGSKTVETIPLGPTGLQALAGELWPSKPTVARKALEAVLAQFAGTEELSDDQQQEAAQRLRSIAGGS